MKRASLLALVLVASVAGAAGRRAQVAPNSIYVRERGGVPNAVMGQDGQWSQLPPGSYAGNGYGNGYDGYQQGPQPGFQGGPQQGQQPMDFPPEAFGDPSMSGGPDGYPMGAPPVGAPPVAGPQMAGPPPVAPPPVRRRCGNPVTMNGSLYCGGRVILEEERFEEEYRYREYEPVETAPPISPFGPPY